MEVLFAIPLLLVPFFMPFIAGQMAKSFGRDFWCWFLIGIPLPFIANIILLCLPDKTRKPGEAKKGKKGDNFTTCAIDEGPVQGIGHNHHYSAKT